MTQPTPALEGFEFFDFSDAGESLPVYKCGTGPGVLLMHEIPGITPDVQECARRIAAAGFTVYMPWMFGTPDKPVSTPYAIGQMLKAICIRKEFTVLARGQSSPITTWLRALARHIHAECGGPGVGAIGMCLTGGFALTLMLEPAVIAPILSQPSLPMPLPGLAKKNGPEIDISPEDLDTVKRRLDEENLTVIGMRFSEDGFCPKARFDNLKTKLGDRFEAIEIDSSPGNEHGFGKMAHSVTTMEYRDQSGFPTRDATERMIAFYKQRLVSEAVVEATE